MRASSEKRIAGAPPHITFLWLGALPKTDALMKACVPKCVSLMLAIVRICYSRGYVFVVCFGVLPFVSDSRIDLMMPNSSYERFTFENCQFVVNFNWGIISLQGPVSFEY